ncbi:hypothetical protein, partial [Dokdonella sp.]|uniref:hypothetical protein n=1 Tax=Dokdonella sp. TaxID=2291710 RepID=UPI003C5373DA
MKKTLLGATVAASLMFAGASFAQNCTPSAGTPVLNGATSGTPQAAFDTCSATDQLAVSCSGLNPIGNATDAVWAVTIGPGAHSGSFNITTSVGTYDIYAGLMSGTCNGSSPCPIEADSNGAGGSETLGPVDGLANGSYFLLVTTFGAGCGPVVIT